MDPRSPMPTALLSSNLADPSFYIAEAVIPSFACTIRILLDGSASIFIQMRGEIETYRQPKRELRPHLRIGMGLS